MVSTIEQIETTPIFFSIIISPEELENLSHRKYTLSDNAQRVFNYKCCPTRHGCSGATNCDYAYGDYHR